MVRSSVRSAHFSRVSTATDTKGQRSDRIEGEALRGSRNQSGRVSSLDRSMYRAPKSYIRRRKRSLEQWTVGQWIGNCSQVLVHSIGFEVVGDIPVYRCPQCQCRSPVRPVLKHGPRSLTYARANGWKTQRRNKSKGRFGRLRYDPRSSRFWAQYRPVPTAYR
jgi:hypothetical protein